MGGPSPEGGGASCIRPAAVSPGRRPPPRPHVGRNVCGEVGTDQMVQQMCLQPFFMQFMYWTILDLKLIHDLSFSRTANCQYMNHLSPFNTLLSYLTDKGHGSCVIFALVLIFLIVTTHGLSLLYQGCLWR